MDEEHPAAAARYLMLDPVRADCGGIAVTPYTIPNSPISPPRCMARLARIVVPGFSHHVTQRGNRHEPIFFGRDDYSLYRALLSERRRKAGVEVWAYEKNGVRVE